MNEILFSLREDCNNNHTLFFSMYVCVYYYLLIGESISQWLNNTLNLFFVKIFYVDNAYVRKAWYNNYRLGEIRF